MNCHYKSVAYIILFFFFNSAFAAKWDLSPQIAISETYHDNVTLQSQNKNKEIISQINPSISLKGVGKKIQLLSSYTLNYLNYYGEEFSDQINHQANLSSDFEVIEKNLFINSAASLSRQTVDPLGKGVGDNLAVTDNKSDVVSVSVNPILINRIGSYANSLFSYKYSYIDFSDPKLASNWFNSYNYSLTSGSWFKTLTWTSSISAGYSSESNANSYQANFRANYVLSKHWDAFILGRATKSNYLSSQGDELANFVAAESGVIWSPSRKFSLELGGGAIFDGRELSKQKLVAEQPTWRAVLKLSPSSRTSLELGREQAEFGRRIYGLLSHLHRRTTLSSEYSEVTSQPLQQRIASDGSFVQGNTTVSQINRAPTNDVVLRRRFSASGEHKRRKVTLNSGAFVEKGEFKTVAQSDRIYGINFGLNISMSRSVSSDFGISMQRYSIEDINSANNSYSLNIAVTKTFAKYLQTSISYNWFKRSANDIAGNYITNIIVAQLKLTY